MNSLTAVVLALVLIVVILLIVWLVLRSRTEGPARGTAASGVPGGDDRRDDDPSAATDEGPAAEGRGPVSSSDNDAAAAQEYVEPGLSELAPEAAQAGEESDTTADAEPGARPEEGVLSGTPPRTPTEAFGSAEGTGEVATEGFSGTSVLDDPDVDSTPLFRTVREELLGTVALEEPSRDAATSEPEEPETVDAALTEEVVAEHPEVDATWSDERRGWDDQAHADTASGGADDAARPPGEAEAVEAQENVWSETLTEGTDETGAAGTGSVVPDQEEEELLETNEETIDGAVATEVATETDATEVRGEHPPMRRISELHEVVDGGYGIGSAAKIDDGAQPLGHPIKASVDTKTYQDLHSPWYDETEPDVWFLDAGFAERAGFHRAE